MNNTRIYKLLKSLSIPTLNRFVKFIQSPYHNVNKRITNFTLLLVNDIKKKNAVLLKKEYWSKLDFEGDYNDLKFRKLCNDMIERFEKFLVNEELNQDEFLETNLLLASLKKNNHESLIEKQINKGSNIFTRSIDNSSDFYLQKYFYDRTLENLKSNFEKKEEIKNSLINESYRKLSDQLDAFYIIEKLRYAIDIITWSKQYKIELDFKIDFILDRIEKNSLDKIPAIKIYKLIYQMLVEDDGVQIYFELKEFAKIQIYNFPKVEQTEIFDALLIYCISWVNKSNNRFYNEYLELNDWGIREEFILKNNILSPTSFRNYVVIGLRAGQFERVEKYINNNISLLEKSRQENALNFNLARLFFYKKDFNQVLNYLNIVNYDDIWYNVNSKMLLLASYYELDEYFVLESTLDAYISFLRRDKLLDSNMKRAYLNFSSNFKRFIKTENKRKLENLKERIYKEKLIFNKDWLLEKIEEKL